MAPNDSNVRCCRVLLVEDHADTAMALTRLLGRRGYEVESAGTAREARAKVSAWGPDVMIVDLGLPDGDGVELVKELKAARPGVRAVAFTGMAMASDVARCRAAGFDGHVSKPATTDVLEAAIRKLCAGRSGGRGESGWKGE